MEFSLFGIVGMPVIAVICYLIGMGVKVSKINDDFIPVICGACGALLGPVGYFVIPGFPATDVMTAVSVGIVSGLAATGANQIIKIVKKLKEDKADVSE